MSETYHTSSGQKVTTYYAPEERSNYEGNAKGDSRREGESRVEQNRRLREEARSKVSTRPDSRENVEKETKRKKAAHEKIEREVEKVRDRQVTEELRESTKKQKRAPAREPLGNTLSAPARIVGSRIPAALGGSGGKPAWLNQSTGLPPALRMGVGSLPPGFSIRAGSPPPWLFGASPINPVRSAKKKPAAMNNGLPPWFRY